MLGLKQVWEVARNEDTEFSVSSGLYTFLANCKKYLFFLPNPGISNQLSTCSLSVFHPSVVCRTVTLFSLPAIFQKLFYLFLRVCILFTLIFLNLILILDILQTCTPSDIDKIRNFTPPYIILLTLNSMKKCLDLNNIVHCLTVISGVKFEVLRSALYKIPLAVIILHKLLHNCLLNTILI